MIKKYFNLYRGLPLGVKAGFWFVICSAVQNGASFISMPFLVRLLTTDEYGTYCVFRSWINIIAIFATLKMSTDVFNNAMYKYPNSRDKYTSSAQSISLIGVLLFFIIYWVFKDFWNGVFGLPTEISVMIFVQLFLSMGYAVWTAKQRYEYKYKKMVISTLIFSVLYLIVPILAGYYAAKSRKLIAVVYSGVAVQFCFGLIFTVYNYFKGRCFFNKEYWKYAIGFNIPLIPHFLSTVILGESDRVMIKNIVGDTQAGIYSFVYTVAIVINIITEAISNAMIPFTYKALGNKDYKTLKPVVNFILLMVCILILMFMSIAPEFIKFFATEEYYDAIKLVPVISLSSFFSFLYTVFSNVEFFFEHNKMVAIASVSGAVANILLNFLLIPVWGYYAAGYTTFVCYVLYSLVHFAFMKRVCKKELNGDNVYDNRIILLISLAVVVGSFFMLLIYDYWLLRYGVFLALILVSLINRNRIIEKLNVLRAKKT